MSNNKKDNQETFSKVSINCDIGINGNHIESTEK